MSLRAFSSCLFGIFLNNWPEMQQMHWKRLPENKRKLYTKGFFSYVWKPNYLGDLFWWNEKQLPTMLFEMPSISFYLKSVPMLASYPTVVTSTANE